LSLLGPNLLSKNSFRYMQQMSFELIPGTLIDIDLC